MSTGVQNKNSHGENRGSSPLGSANDFNSLGECAPAKISRVRQIYGMAAPELG
jgi:hypothetical protein